MLNSRPPPQVIDIFTIIIILDILIFIKFHIFVSITVYRI